MFSCAFGQWAKLFRTRQSQNLNCLPTVIIWLQKHNLYAGIYMFCQLRCVETFLDVIFVSGLTLRVWEWLSIEKEFIQVFHSILKDSRLSLLINLILPHSTVNHNPNFPFGTSLNSISPCQGSKPTIPYTNNRNLFSIGKHVIPVKVINGLNDIFWSLEVHDLVLVGCIWIAKVRSTITRFYHYFWPWTVYAVWWENAAQKSKWATPVFAWAKIYEVTLSDVFLTLSERIIEAILDTPSLPNILKID